MRSAAAGSARVYCGMEVKTTSVSGFLRFWLLGQAAALAPEQPTASPRSRPRSRPGSALIAEAAQLSGDLALEVAECARLIKGYGDTHKRGSANYHLIEARVIGPVLDGPHPAARGIDAIASARTAALIDPEGDSLGRCLAEVEERNALPIAAE